ncbi:hypothetical protein [Metabacillus halosaccharovorans]|uniref:hypothetical protein n=1 Tax=Metabacillus halosaccharovorans TaxID=930124 RepID=UPI002040A743|nr:hypothetical protein [Metabacillus halosaccharovorans]MCM3443155.1 hypothetical protein [Metabacillus halosaccharovorans]
MKKYKLKSIYLKQNADNPLQVKESATQDLVVLRVGDHEVGTNNYHHFRVPVHATVDIRYEATDQKSILRFIFQQDQRNLSIQYFTRDKDEQHYIDTPLNDELIQSMAFQRILQSINFSGKNHFSYLVNPIQRLKDQLY